MVLDPFSALSLAGNIVQFVDFSRKLIAGTRTIYRSATGTTATNDVLEAITTNLNHLTDNIIISSSRGTAAAGKELRAFAYDCKEVANELLTVLEELRMKNPHSKWKSFVAAWEEVRRKDQIKELSGRLERLQRQLNTHLLYAMSNQQSDILKALLALDDESKRLEIERNKRLQQLEQEVLGAIKQLQPAVQLQTMNVGDYLDSIHQGKPVTPEDMINISEKMQNLSVSISSLATVGRTVASEQMLLKSLCFKHIKARHADIAEAHTKTFSWVFKNTLAEGCQPIKFVDWLRSQSGTYWIMGKAGSGKSTLTKFICDHDRTKEELNAWAGQKRLVTAKYFFWNAGTPLQKSQEGLLQSLLFEVLRKCPELIPAVCSKWPEFIPYQNEPDPWTRKDLLHTFSQLEKQTDVSARFCFFIDGLDEYNGDQHELIKVLQGLAVSPDIKLCLSSRPWQSFKDAFGQDVERFLKLEDLTREDIRLYVHNKLGESVHFRQLKTRDTRYPELVTEILNKAQGVFLWVFLAVRSLVQGLTNADRISDLQRRLSLLPPTLEDYFRHIFNSVEEVYKEQTAQAFQVSLQAAEPLSLMTFSFLDEEDPNFGFRAKVEPLSRSEILSRQEDMRRRLDGRCKGLLEVTLDTSNDWGIFFAFKVDFLHRTVRDFLLTGDMQKLLEERLDPAFNAKAALCNAFLAQLKAVPPVDISKSKSTPLDDILEDLLNYAKELEVEADEPQIKLLDEAERVVCTPSSIWKWKRKKTAFLGLAVQRDLQLYVKHRLMMHSQLIRGHGRPLLDHALMPSPPKHGLRSLSPQMVNILLNSGAMPNQKYKDSTVWGRFVLTLKRNEAPSADEITLDVLSSLLTKGADLNKSIVVDYEYRSGRRSTGRGGDLFKGEVRVDVCQTAYSIISHVFPDDYLRLRGIVHGQRASRLSGWFSWLSP